MDSEQELVLRSQRKTVSTWVESLVGIPVPTASDYSFRSVLQDGSLLCQLMETLKPGSVPKVEKHLIVWKVLQQDSGKDGYCFCGVHVDALLIEYVFVKQPGGKQLIW